MCRTTRYLGSGLAAALPMLALAAPIDAVRKLPINISSGGDDQLTQTLVASLGRELAASGRYELVPEGKQDIQLVIPGHVYWKAVGQRTNIHYVVVVVGKGSIYLGAVDGSCWSDEMGACVRQMLADMSRAGVLAGQ